MSRFICLMYHNVCRPDQLGPDGPFAKLGPSIQSYSVTTTQFAEHLSAVGSQRWMGPDELREPTSTPAQSPRVLITFDDGWAGSIDEAGPLLAEAEARALLFVTTGLIGHRLFASEAMLRSLPVDRFEIGAHTVTHPFLSECSTSQITRELKDSRAELEDIVGRPVETMSFPNGSLNDRVLEIAHECGYAFVFTSDPRINVESQPKGGIGRVAVRSTTSSDVITRWSNGDLGSAGWRRIALGVSRDLLGAERYRRLRGWALGQDRDNNDMADLVASHARTSRELVSSN